MLKIKHYELVGAGVLMKAVFGHVYMFTIQLSALFGAGVLLGAGNLLERVCVVLKEARPERNAALQHSDYACAAVVRERAQLCRRELPLPTVFVSSDTDGARRARLPGSPRGGLRAPHARRDPPRARRRARRRARPRARRSR